MKQTEQKKSRWIAALPYLLLFVFWATAPLYIKKMSWLNIFILIFFKCIGAVSLRTISLSGNISFAHGAFMGIGAYAAAMFAKWLGMPAYLAIPIGAVIAMLIGVLTGLPFVKLRTIYYSMASMFFGVFIVNLIAAGGSLTGGALGLKDIPAMFKSQVASYYLFFGIASLSLLFMYRFEFSRIGTTLRAISQSDLVAASIGVNVILYKLLAVGVGCFFAGLSGAVYALYNTTLDTGSFGMNLDLWLIVYMMIGGMDKFIGPILGATLLVLIPEYLTNVSSGMNMYIPYATAIILIAVAYAVPGGLASLPRRIGRALDAAREKAAAKNMASAASGKGGNEHDA